MAALAADFGVDCAGQGALMATIILSAVGNQLAGPIGGTIGAIVGQQIDNRIFAPKGRKGPRLNELAVQSSSYGSPIPKLFGITRVAGTVIWSTDLKETKRKISNGKGQPKSTVYSYSASFAVAISARRIVRIERIWADGNLLRGTAGDFKTETGFRLYHGTEGQDVDPLIASAQGIGVTPAYRGTAYAVFENFQLGDYGNRIPSLSFEVVADEGAVNLGDAIENLADGAVEADWDAAVDGIAVTGESVRGLIETLTPLYPVFSRQIGSVIALRSSLVVSAPLAERDLGASLSGEPKGRIEVERRASLAMPSSVSVSYYDAARDYQPGVQTARGFGGGRQAFRVELPTTLDAAAAKGLASAAVRRAWLERSTARLRLPWRALALAPGQSVKIPSDTRQWRVSGVSFEQMTMVADLVSFGPVAMSALPSDPGGGLLEPDLIHGPTVFHVLDLPALDGQIATAPRIVVAAAGTSPGWRRASLLVSTDSGTSWQEAGGTAVPATIGSALSALPPGTTHVRDDFNSVDVELLNAEMALNDANEEALLAGANAAVLGSEIFQYASAIPIGAQQYRLSGLLRGRRGTEWASAAHATGDRFVLLTGETLTHIDVAPDARELQVMAVGVGDTVPPVRNLTVAGEAIIPPSVAHLSAERLSSGDTEIGWIRRSRCGWHWPDGADAPLVEEFERYRIILQPGVGAARSFESSSPAYLYTATDRDTDVLSGAAETTVTVVQLGTFGPSRPASVTFSIA